MMPMEKQVTNLELSKKLRDLGIPQESAFYWYPEHQNRLSDGTLSKIPLMLVDRNYRNGTSPNDNFISAFTCSELGEMLPAHLQIDKYQNSTHLWGVYWTDMKHESHSERDNDEVNARAKMLIWLLEQGILKPERLTP